MPGFDVTPRIPSGRQVIHGYGDGGFRIAGERHDGSVVVFRGRTVAWSVTTIDNLSDNSLDFVADADDPVQILLVGCGLRFAPPPPGLREALKDQGIVLEWMDTGAACRTFNVLLAEDRDVAAALIAVA